MILSTQTEEALKEDWKNTMGVIEWQSWEPDLDPIKTWERILHKPGFLHLKEFFFFF